VPHGAGVGRERAREEAGQRRLAAAVWPNDADALAAFDADRKVAHHRGGAVALGEALRLDREGAKSFRGGVHYRLAGGAAVLASLLAQPLKLRHTAYVALAPCRDAVTHPVLFGLDLAVELDPLPFLLGQEVVAPRFEMGETALQTARPCRGQAIW